MLDAHINLALSELFIPSQAKRGPQGNKKEATNQSGLVKIEIVFRLPQFHPSVPAPIPSTLMLTKCNARAS
jgi:hypothetical protein